MQKLELFDETFDPNRTESYELSIQLSLNGFSFCVNDLVRNCFIALVSNTYSNPVSDDDWFVPVQNIIESYEWIKNPFKKVIFSYESPIFTLVPKGFHEPEKSNMLLELVHPIPELYELRFNNIDDSATCIYALPSMLVSEWKAIHPKTHFIGFCEPVIAFHKSKNVNPKTNSITLAFNGKFAVVVISKGIQFQHCTTIDSLNPNDISYYLLNMCNSLDIESTETTVSVTGNHNETELLESLLSQFFKDYSLATNLDQNHFSYLLNRYKGKFANLFNQSLCEL
ncbi:MAG TPA: DUF3822 family protein [Tenuifilaceae bacterium]|nr:DUF3822 family protein [Tenuifilaceae bacterium]HPE18324.1 DUF3822 family protein [Tenuifilaceae bacterium]HPJ45982.1 DUF3822 family protein [Tenuifilaceae bacterium]HPQ34361.1 DUF3822 family protein [Tenuifilaceae bacterium]HRX68303.1 DUF3822 family protein [Tenuifilaceae bacterium]